MEQSCLVHTRTHSMEVVTDADVDTTTWTHGH